MSRALDVPDLTSLAGVDPEAFLVAPPPGFGPAPERPVPGMLLEGVLPPGPARFLLRLPESWNGGLVVAAAPGLLGERSLDLYWSDFCVPRGFAFACTDKGARAGFVNGEFVLPSGEECRIRHWYARLRALAELAIRRCGLRYGRGPEAVYAVGVSNGGYLARSAMERDPGLFAGGVDVSGPLWRADEPTLLRELPRALAGPAGSPLDEEYHPIRNLTMRALLDDLDPDYRGALSAYEPALRPQAAERVREIELTGRLRRPLVSIAGGCDLLVPAASHAEGYARLVERAGAAALHELRVVPLGTHVDSERARYDWVEPLMPHAHAAFLELAAAHTDNRKQTTVRGLVPWLAAAAVAR